MMVIDKFHISLFNILNELIYIYDCKTYDVLFINNTAKSVLKIKNNIPLKKDVENSPFFKNILHLDNGEEKGNFFS